MCEVSDCSAEWGLAVSLLASPAFPGSVHDLSTEPVQGGRGGNVPDRPHSARGQAFVGRERGL